MKSGLQPEMYVMICGRVTPAQREITRRSCTINANDYMTILNWLIKNHPSYSDMVLPENCPQPIFIGGFDEEVNNTEFVHGSNLELETTIEGEEVTYAARKDPNESTGPFYSEKDLIVAYIKGEKPTLL